MRSPMLCSVLSSLLWKRQALNLTLGDRTKDMAVLCGHWGLLGDLAQWFHGADLPVPSQPPESRGVEGTMQGCPGSGSSLCTPHGARGLTRVGQMRLLLFPISQYLDEMGFKRAATVNYTNSHSFSVEKRKHSSGSFAAHLGNPINPSAPWSSGRENLDLRPP